MKRLTTSAFLIQMLLAFLCCCIATVCWMVLFLLLVPDEGSTVGAFMWLLAPFFSATGAALGLLFYARWSHQDARRWQQLIIWPLIACTFGAVLLFWLAPDLILFGLVATAVAGAAAQELRQES